MQETHKENLINQLASSFGMGDIHNTKYGDSRFDASTGTLYCEGISIPKSMISKALDYYAKQKEYNKKMAGSDPTLMDQYLISVVAHNAISMLIDNVKR